LFNAAPYVAKELLVASAGLKSGAIFAASISVVCKCLLRCFDSGVRWIVPPELFSAPHSPQYLMAFLIEEKRCTSSTSKAHDQL